MSTVIYPAAAGGQNASGTGVDITSALVDITSALALKAPLASPHFTGNVGIGTASPQTMLHLSGAVELRLQSNVVGGTAWMSLYDSTTRFGYVQVTGGAFRFNSDVGYPFCFAGGNLGVGVVSAAVKLHVDDSGGGYLRLSRTAIGGGTSTVAVLQAYTATTNLANMVVAEDGATDSAHIRFEVKPTGGSLTERMRIDASGNLIYTVNTTAPSLTTDGTMTVERTSNTQLTFKMRGSDGVTRSGTLTLS